MKLLDHYLYLLLLKIRKIRSTPLVANLKAKYFCIETKRLLKIHYCQLWNHNVPILAHLITLCIVLDWGHYNQFTKRLQEEWTYAYEVEWTTLRYVHDWEGIPQEDKIRQRERRIVEKL